MLLHSFISRASAVVVVALVVLTSIQTHAAPAGAQLGPIWTAGALTSGGSVSYQLNLTVTSPGVLIVSATLKGKHLSLKFPILTNSLVVGITTVTSGPVSIPTNFTGTAVLHISARYGKRGIGSKSVLITITPPAPAPPQTTWYDVGFNSNVTVNAGAVSTNGFTAPITYAWTITDTDVRTNATFSSASAAAPTFTTLPITSFTSAVVFASHVAPGVDLDKQYDLDTNPNLVGFNYEQQTLTTYDLQVIISDAASHVSTGQVTVLSTSVSPAQPSIPLGERQYLTAMPNGTNASTYSWSFVGVPPGSTAVVENPKTRTASLRPDKEGDYVMQLTVTGGGVSTSSYVTVKGATYVGVATCASCHGTNPQVGLKDYYTPWSQTEHATMAQRGVDGLLAPDYNESCFACHTLGYNKAPLAQSNGNFYAVEQQLGWKFPTVLQVGNYASMPTKLQNLANIQCENCHGPGSQHPGAESKSLDVAVCAQCHQDGEFHNRPSQWALGPHGADDGYLSISINEAPNASCNKCHSPQGLVDYLKGNTPLSTEAGRLTCAGCHDPHNVAMFPEAAHQVRVYNTVTLDSIDMNTGTNVVLTDQGPSAMCMFCHNARRGPFQLNKGAAYYLGGTPHESTATDVLLGLNACTNIVVTVVSNGVTNVVEVASVALKNSAHTGVAKCVDCHMFPDSNPAFNGSNTVGDHTFSMTDRLSGSDNLPACNQCHAGVDPVTDFDHVSVVNGGHGDYDGDGVVNGVQTEISGLMTNLANKMIATGLIYTGAGGSPWGGFAGNANPIKNAAQRAAVWNYQMIANERSVGVHNTAYEVGLLQWTYTVVSTNSGGNAFPVDYPAADLR